MEHQASASGEADLSLIPAAKLPAQRWNKAWGEAVVVERYLMLPWLDIAIDQSSGPFGCQLFISPEVGIALSPWIEVDTVLAKRVIEESRTHEAVIAVMAFDPDEPDITMNRLRVIVLGVGGYGEIPARAVIGRAWLRRLRISAGTNHQQAERKEAFQRVKDLVVSDSVRHGSGE